MMEEPEEIGLGPESTVTNLIKYAEYTELAKSDDKSAKIFKGATIAGAAIVALLALLLPEYKITVFPFASYTNTMFIFFLIKLAKKTKNEKRANEFLNAVLENDLPEFDRLREIRDENKGGMKR